MLWEQRVRRCVNGLGPLRRSILCFSVAALGAGACEASGAAKIVQLIEQLQQNLSAKPPARVRFDLSEGEINEYLRFTLTRTPRPGLAAAHVRIFPGNYFATLTTVDFTAIEQWKPSTIPAVLRPLLSGQRKVQVDLRFAPVDGFVRFRVEKAEFEGVPIPAIVVNEVIRVLAARQPERYDTSQPLPLPFGLKTFWTTAGRVQGQNY